METQLKKNLQDVEKQEGEMKMAKVNIRAKDRKAAMNKFKDRYGKNFILSGVMYNKDMDKEKFGMKSYTCIAKKKPQ